MEGEVELVVGSGLKPLVILGRILGIFNPNILPSNKYKRSKKFQILHKVYCSILGLYYFMNLCKSTTTVFKNTTSHTSNQLGLIRDLMVYGSSITILFLYIYLTYSSKQLKIIIQTITSLSKPIYFKNYLKNATYENLNIWKRFPCFSKVVLAVLLLVTGSESIVFGFRSLECNKNYTSNDFWRGRNILCFQEQPVHTTILAMFLLVGVKLMLFLRTFSDILLIVLCQAMKNVLLVYNHDITQIYSESSSGNNSFSTNIPSWWIQIRLKYLKISDLVEQMTNFIYPLILSCYWINIYLVIDNLFIWISPNKSTASHQTWYNYFAFMTYSLRVTLVTYFAAEVYQTGKLILKTLQKCPEELSSPTVDHLERSMMSNPLGISFFGAFVITRKFFVSIISFIFTTEIVLLQTNPSST